MEMKETVIATRWNEMRIKTSDPDEMRGKYTRGRVTRRWTQDFADKGSGEVVSVERNEVLFERGTLIEGEVLSRMLFYLQSGDIKEVEVSTQQRRAQCIERRDCLYPFAAKAMVSGRPKKFLLYAGDVSMCIDVLRDYIELNYEGGFHILSVQGYNTRIILTDHMESTEGEVAGKNERRYYHIDFWVTYEDDIATEWSAVVYASDAERAMLLITDYMIKLERERVERGRKRGEDVSEREITTRIEECKQVKFYAYIPREFSEAYLDGAKETRR